MTRLINIITVLFSSVLVSAIGFQGQIINIPKQVNELYHEKNVVVVNGDNYPARIKVDLYNLESDEKTTSLVQQDYSFKFQDLKAGIYELIVNSYDFEFYTNRYRILVNDEIILAFEDRLGENSYNKTSEVNITKTPLTINFKYTKQFYENPQGSIGDWFLNGPFGFIFRNRVYTIIFTVMMGLSVAPYVLKWINPELAKELQEIQVQASKQTLEKAPAPSKSQPQGNIRKRK
ncbi:uncharacterized protein SPAPADRAFT_52041 [Spathaspora passalidarum NRRL Y-27907]|uniref:ER membrane protein complex subunit 7 beta-sandwich domain-containing protein n=1 Tax=Spathaspora passalidarum (strain NRRL Y-27907 / 11-Y1) TaxID=619300 RepID=G3AT79_SPAPN|nr:uncharacterized protein SPAPADRAFT_52041 [Spathaspora passalidarum NRRL Y-27907]EGW30843.1 hypothetical protein SPAPADRAFT_52041 [Spathaspora passalidarum NRRL Y-27907]